MSPTSVTFAISDDRRRSPSRQVREHGLAALLLSPRAHQVEQCC